VGINKAGGAGRISQVNDDGTYNVKYALGGSEKNIDEKWVREVHSEVHSSPVKAVAVSPAEEADGTECGRGKRRRRDELSDFNTKGAKEGAKEGGAPEIPEKRKSHLRREGGGTGGAIYSRPSKAGNRLRPGEKLDLNEADPEAIAMSYRKRYEPMYQIKQLLGWFDQEGAAKSLAGM
jgi:hypothetical protein